MIEGKSLAKTAKLCGVHPTTAFRWRHRFLRAPADDKPRSLSGIVEADETFILESFKGRWSDLPRKACKRGRPPVGTENRAFETFCRQPETAANFFIRIARNSLKSFDSKKINASKLESIY